MAFLKRDLSPEVAGADRCTLVFDTDSKRLYVELEVVAHLDSTGVVEGVEPPRKRENRDIRPVYGRSVLPIRYRSHSRAAPRPSLMAHTTRL